MIMQVLHGDFQVGGAYFYKWDWPIQNTIFFILHIMLRFGLGSMNIFFSMGGPGPGGGIPNATQALV